MDENLEIRWMMAEKINCMQVNLKDKNFFVRIDKAKDTVVFVLRADKDAFEIIMDEDSWEYFYGRIKQARLREKQLTRKKKGDDSCGES